MNSDEKFLVCLYSEPNFLAVNILENLLANNCFVNVVTENSEEWNKRTTNIVTRNRFNIITHDKFQEKINYGYIIFCSGFLDKVAVADDLRKFLIENKYRDTKTFFILPREVYGVLDFTKTNISDNAGVIYLGDLLGPRIDLGSNLRLPICISEIIDRRRISVEVGEVFYPLFVSDAAKQIVKWLFAFGPFGKEVFLLGPETSPNVFWQVNERMIGEIQFITNEVGVPDRIPRNMESFRIERNLGYCLTETYKWISSLPPLERKYEPVMAKKSRKPAVRNRPHRRWKNLFIPLLLILLLPIITTVIGGGAAYVSFISFKSGHDKNAINFLYVSSAVSRVGYFESRVLKQIPLFGQLYKETEYASYALMKTSEIGTSAVPLVKTADQLFGYVLGKSPYSISSVLGESDKGLQQIYDSVADLEENTVKDKMEGSLLAGLVLSKVNLESYKNLVSQLIVLERKLPDVLGRDGSKTYLVLFENNMELRPTGGFIGSYGLLTFDNGRLSDFAISDVYSADGQLNGHVEPPTPIKQYLGEANWWFRDSNWDPDFPTSAKRAEWFLDKEIDRQVDGVVSVDLNPVKYFLQVSGPIYLSDYGLDITPDNLYEKVQSEVQENFFPGTHNKASFLTALSRSILAEAGSLSSTQKMSVMNLVYQSLESRHIQIFMHEGDFQKAVGSLGWDGSVFTPTCGQPCYSDLVGIVEANVGVNKSNYFVKREVLLAIRISGDEIIRTLTLTLQNTANPTLGASGRYKSYIRLLVPEDSADIKVESVFGQNSEEMVPEVTGSKGRKEIGVIFEVLGGETKKLVFSWSGKTVSSIEDYNLYFRRQAGVEDYPLNVRLTTNSNVFGMNPAFALTDQGDYTYNTTLTRDLFARFSF
jgi:hypothetical protein